MADNSSSIELAGKDTNSNIIIGDLLVAMVPAKGLAVVFIVTSK